MPKRKQFYTIVAIVCLATPLLLFIIVISLDYNKIHTEKLQGARYTCGILYEHALNVFETHHLVGEQVNEHIRTMTWADIGTSVDLQRYLAKICTRYPQVQAIWLADANGRVRNASQQLPPDPVTVADRDYFMALSRTNADLFVGEVVAARVMKGLNFNIAQRRTRSGLPDDPAFDGIIIVTVFPDYFLSMWNKAIREEHAEAALVRNDGKVLVRSPQLNSHLTQLAEASSTMQAIKGGTEGQYTGTSTHDGTKRHYSYRKVGRYDAYLVYGITSESMIAKWRTNAALYGVFFGLAAMALYFVAQLARKEALLQVEAEENLSKAYTEMETRVVERTAELVEANERLLKEVEMRQQTEQHLVKFSSAIQQSPVSILITDAQGTIEYANPIFSEITGYPPEEVIGQNPRILKSGETAPKTYRELWDTITAGNVWHGEFHNRKRNGDLFLERATIAPLMDENGTITHFIAVKEDITQVRALETQLHHAQKMEAIGVLAGGVAHDFNNILTAIIGFASMMEMKLPEEDPLRHNVTEILSAADRAANLTRSLLAFSRKQTVEIKTVDLNKIVAGIEKMLRRIIREDIELQVTLCAQALPVRADALQLEQVLLNLVTNARDAIPSTGKVTITTSRETISEEFINQHGFGQLGEFVLLEVSDNGTGMEESVQQRIFDPFFTTKELGKGTGLGLSVCYGIIKQHNGYIVCKSVPGEGTNFLTYLPLDGSATDQLPSGPVGEYLPRGTETILLAEDDPMVQQLTVSLLREFGYSVVVVSNGEEAVARFREFPDSIDLCLFDVIMPKKNGLEAAAEIKNLAPCCPFLFMSGYSADVMQTNRLIEEEIYLAKPLRPGEFLKKLRHALDSSIGVKRAPQE